MCLKTTCQSRKLLFATRKRVPWVGDTQLVDFLVFFKLVSYVFLYCCSISLISNLFSAKNTFLLYFGAKTMWYLQFHFVCAKLLLALFSFIFNVLLMWFFVATGRSLLYYTTLGVFISDSPVNLYGTPRLSWGFLYTTKAV